MEARHGQSMQFGDLVLQFTSQFSYRWNDRGSGGHHDGSYWHPIPPAGYRALGSLGFAGYGDPNNNWALCVKEANPGSGAFRNPTGYDLIWADHGSGADDDGSCWRPRAPAGYVALGDVFQRGYDPPSVEDVVCVRQDLAVRGVLGNFIWDDSGTGSDRDFGSWEIVTAKNYTDGSKIALAANTFFGVDSHSKPNPIVYTLSLPVPVVKKPSPQKPALASRERPPATDPIIDRIVTVPFTAVLDDELPLQWKLTKSPFYDVERWVNYDLVLFNDNNTGSSQKSSQQVATGVTNEQSETFETRTGISVTYESGVEVGGVSSKVSSTLSLELGFSTTTSVSTFKSTTYTVEMETLPDHSAATWCAKYTLQAVRSDNTVVGSPLAFDENGSFLQSEYPREGRSEVWPVNAKVMA